MNNFGSAGLAVSLLILAGCQCLQHGSETSAKAPAPMFERFVFLEDAAENRQDESASQR